MLANTKSPTTTPVELEQSLTNKMLLQFSGNIQKVILPLFITLMCSTLTYPVAVRVSKRVFGLTGFYPIHIAIAPFLAFIHVNIFGVTHMYFRIKHIEREFDSLIGFVGREQDYGAYSSVNKQIMKQYSEPKPFQPKSKQIT